jgi:hypothetical protein
VQGLDLHFPDGETGATGVEAPGRAALVGAAPDATAAGAVLDATDAAVTDFVATTADEAGLGGYPAVADRLADDAVLHVPDPDPAAAVERVTGEAPAHETRTLRAERPVPLGTDRQITPVTEPWRSDAPDAALLVASAWAPGAEPPVSNALLTPGLDPGEERAAADAFADLYADVRASGEFQPASETGRRHARVVDQRHRPDGSVGPLVDDGTNVAVFGTGVEPTGERLDGLRRAGVADGVFGAFHGATTVTLGERAVTVTPERGSTALDEVPEGLAAMLAAADDPPARSAHPHDGVER